MDFKNSDREWDIRTAVKDDLHFIYSNWMTFMRYRSNLGKTCKATVFLKEYIKVIDYILDQDTTSVWIAYPMVEPEVIVGYCVVDYPVVHFAYVKRPFRNLGITKSLLQTAGFRPGQKIEFTNTTLDIAGLRHMHDELEYNPFKLYKQKEE